MLTLTALLNFTCSDWIQAWPWWSAPRRLASTSTWRPKFPAERRRPTLTSPGWLWPAWPSSSQVSSGSRQQEEVKESVGNACGFQALPSAGVPSRGWSCRRSFPSEWEGLLERRWFSVTGAWPSSSPKPSRTWWWVNQENISSFPDVSFSYAFYQDRSRLPAWSN